MAKPHSRPSNLVVVLPVKKWTCTSCGGTGDLLKMEDGGPLCVDCADLGHLVFLPSGDAALTRRAMRISGLSAVVVRWSRTRKRYERQGILAEAEAIEGAEQECLSDAEARARRQERDKARRASDDVRFQTEFAAAIRNLFPGCPPDRAEGMARHAATRSSGRIGRQCGRAGPSPRRCSPRRCGIGPARRHRLRRAADVGRRPGDGPTPGTPTCRARVGRLARRDRNARVGRLVICSATHFAWIGEVATKSNRNVLPS